MRMDEVVVFISAFARNEIIRRLLIMASEM